MNDLKTVQMISICVSGSHLKKQLFIYNVLGNNIDESSANTNVHNQRVTVFSSFTLTYCRLCAEVQVLSDKHRRRQRETLVELEKNLL